MDFFVWKEVPYKAGDVILIDFPDTQTREIAKIHPAILVGYVNMNPMNLITVIPISSTMERKNIPYTIVLKRTGKNKLANDCVALVYHLTAVDPLRLKHRIGELDDEDFDKVRLLMKDHLKLL